MPDWDTVLLIVDVAVVALVLGVGAFQAWRDWSDNRRIGKHLGK
jgi:hypothetical protein